MRARAEWRMRREAAVRPCCAARAPRWVCSRCGGADESVCVFFVPVLYVSVCLCCVYFCHMKRDSGDWDY